MSCAALGYRYTHPTINKSLIVMATEASKILIAFISILIFQSHEELIMILKGWNLSESLQVAALPAILYAIQNVLIQHGYNFLNSLTFNLLNQTKVSDLSFRYKTGNPMVVN